MRLKVILPFLLIGFLVKGQVSLDSLNTQIVQNRTKDVKNLKNLIKNAYDKAKKQKDIRYQGIFLREMGIYYKRKGILDSAEYYYLKGLDKLHKTNDSTSVNATHLSLGNLYKSKGEYQKSINFFLKAISYFEKSTDKKIQFKSLVGKFNLAGLYQSMLDQTNALKTYKTILSHNQFSKSKQLQKSTYINLSGLYSTKKEADSALIYAFKAIPLTKKKLSLANLNNNIGTAYEQKNKFSKAILHFKKAEEYYNKANNLNGIIKSKNNIGNIYNKQKKYKLAETYLLESNRILDSTNYIFSKQHNLKMLTNLYKNKNQFDKAFLFQQKLIQLKDTILNKEKQKSIKEIETKYQIDKNNWLKEKAITEKKIAENKSKQNKYYFIGSSIIGFLILLTAILFVKRLKNKKKIEFAKIELLNTQKQLALEQQYRNSELKALKAQMNPHFVFNVMNSIQEYILLNKKNEASEYLIKFANLIRNFLNFSDKGSINLSKELENLSTYLDLESLRFNNDFTYLIKVEDTIDKEFVTIPTMLLQPHIENAIQHGLFHKKGEKKLEISICRKEDNLHFLIKDNGIGRKRSKQINYKNKKEHQSFATKAQKSRLNLLNYARDKKIRVIYHDLKSVGNISAGTLVEIIIPNNK